MSSPRSSSGADLKYAARPPDATHPYGHGKAEPVASILGSLTILSAGAGLAVESVRTIYTPRHPPSVFTLPVLVLVVVIKEIHSRRVQRLARETGSTAMAADAVHHRSDALTSLSAFIGISIALLGGKGFESADAWAALFACAVIAYNGLLIIRPAISDLMDTAPSQEIVDQVRRASAAVDGVFEIEQCRVRKMGLEYYVDLHATVDAGISVRDGHAIAHLVKDAVLTAVPDVADVLVHIEPAREFSKLS